MYDEGSSEDRTEPLFIHFSYTILFTVTATTQKELGLNLRHVRNLQVVKIVLDLMLAFLSALFYMQIVLVFG